MNDSDAIEPVLAGEKDRTNAVKAVGVLLILFGALISLWVPFGFWAQTVMDRSHKATTDFRLLLPMSIGYLTLAVLFGVLGTGMTRRRRWARALGLVVAWSWLVTGIFSIGMMAAILPATLREMPRGPVAVAMLAMLVLLAGLFLCLPVTLIWFLRSNGVRRQFAAAAPDWTDACPLRLLALSGWLCAAAVMIIAMLFGHQPVWPCFGTLVTGNPAAVLCLGIAGACVYLARAVYLRRPCAWWLVVAAVFIGAISNGLTFSRVDVAEMYRLMGYSADHIVEMQRFALVNSRNALLWSQVLVLPTLAYLVWVKPLFRADERAMDSTGRG